MAGGSILGEFDGKTKPHLSSPVFAPDSFNKESVTQSGLKGEDVYFGIRVLRNDCAVEINFSPFYLLWATRSFLRNKEFQE